MRWLALGIDYEMSGKDLISSVDLSSKILRALGGDPPEGFNYELFLDENGERISKSRGNGLTIEEWLTYGPEESIALFMFQKPRAAKRLYFDVIPKAVDDYIELLKQYHALKRRRCSASKTPSGISMTASAGGNLSRQLSLLLNLGQRVQRQ
jgi:lysyl-tRNA synthetase class 1